MAEFQKMNSYNAQRVLDNIGRLIHEDEHLGPWLLDALNIALDEMLADDAFGTEGQLDPRGDHRE